MNRFFRRMERFGKPFSRKRTKGLMTHTDEQVYADPTPQDVTSTRAKSDRHKTSTADKWNQ